MPEQRYEVTLTERSGRKYSQTFRATDPQSALLAALGSKDNVPHSYDQQILVAEVDTLRLYAAEVGR